MKNESNEHQSAMPTAKSNGHWRSPMRDGAAAVELRDQILDAAKKAYGEIVDVASQTASSANKRAAQYIRQYPVQVAAGALCAGILLGATMFRRRA